MKLRSHHAVPVLLAGAITLLAFVYLGAKTPNVYAACGTGASVIITSPSAAATVNGIYHLQAGTNTSAPTPIGVTFSITAPTSTVIGNAAATINGSTTVWDFPWETTTIADGAYQLAAVVHYDTNTANDCSSAPVTVTVRNQTSGGTQIPTLSLSITPNTWNGQPGQSAAFAVSGTYKNQYGTAYPVTAASGATFTWSTTAGKLAQTAAPSTNLTAGTALGTFPLNARVTMNNLTAETVATIKIISATSTATKTPTPTPIASKTPPPGTTSNSPSPLPLPSSSPLPGITTVLTPAEIAELTSTPTVFRPITPTNATPVVPVSILGCMKARIGSNYQAISNGQAQPTADERLNATACFSGSDKIPANLAPVAPSHLTEIAANHAIVRLDTVKNATISDSQGKKTAVIFISGTSTPNSSVFLYFFSDPMVLRAETDKDGKYNYVLQNPLAPGKHEVYAVAGKDADTFVRTSAVPINVAAAASNAQNGSLVLESRFQPVQMAFMIGSILMILLSIIILYRIIRHPRRRDGLGLPVVLATGSTANPHDNIASGMPIGQMIMPSSNDSSPLAPTGNKPPQP